MSVTAEQGPFGVVVGSPAAFKKRLDNRIILFSLIPGVLAAIAWFTSREPAC